MIHKHLLIPAVLAVAGLLLASDSAFAQRGGSRGGGGGHSVNAGARTASPAAHSAGPAAHSASPAAHSASTFHGGSAVHGGNNFHNGNFHNGNFHNGNFYRQNGYYYHHGYRYGYPGFVIGFGFYGPWYPYGYPWDYYGAPGVAFFPPTPGVLDAPPAAPPAVDTPLPEGAPKNAQIKVMLPDPQAKVWFDGTLTTSTGAERLFHTPDLTAGATNTYRIRATWMANGKEMTQEFVVPVAAGRGTVVDFTRQASESVAPPANKE